MEVTYTVRRILFFALVLAIIVPAHSAFAQTLPNASAQAMTNNAVQEMQKNDPQAAQALSSAIQKGDFQAAKKIYQDFQKSRTKTEDVDLTSTDPRTAEDFNRAIAAGEFEKAQKILRDFQKKNEKQKPAAAGQGPSLFEMTLSGDFPSYFSTSLSQFGYDTFNRTAASFTPSGTLPVGPDYIMGPGDQLTVTLWGTTEGIYTFTVTREGNITLPKVGVVPVAGIRFGELEKTLKRHLSRYYANFSLSVAMGELKTVTVYVVGEVANPGSYSLPSLTTVYGALFAAGGPTKKGTMRSVQVLRSGKVVKTLDLYDFLIRGDRSQDMRLQHEDTVFVPLIGPVAGVSGTVYRPAIYELKGGETVGDLIRTAGGIMPISLGSRLQLTRFAENQKKVILDVKLSNPEPASPERVAELREKIQNMDTVTVFPVYDKVWETVNLNGHVRHPGDYQWRPDLKLTDLIAMGQLLPTSDLRRAEVIRLKKDFMDREVIAVDLDKLLNGDRAGDVALQPQDLVRVYTAFRDAEKITVTGEVVRPGTYEIYKGERLSDLLRRVGGFTPEAYVYGTMFRRRNVKESQARNLQSFISRVQSQVFQSAAQGAATALSAEEASLSKAELNLNQSLLENLKAMQEQQEGRVAINITGNIDEWAGSKDDLLFQDGDSLNIPKRPQEVLVMGEIYSPGAQVYLPEMTVKDYIERAGGYAKYAEKDEVFVIQANGFAFGADSPTVGDIEDVKLNPGDSVFVPQKVERYAGMRFTKDIIDILFKTAVVLATITVIF